MPDLIVYLRTSPESVFERMKARMRGEECAVPLSYLKDLHKFYEGWIGVSSGICKIGPESSQTFCPVVVLDADLDGHSVISQFEWSVLPQL